VRYCTFQYGPRVGAGLIYGRLVIDLGQAFQRYFKRPAKFRDLGEFLAEGGLKKAKTLDLASIKEDRVVAIPQHEVKLKAPLARPPKIVCVGLNYKAHAAEQNIEPPKAPMLFAKAPNIVIGPEEAIQMPVGLSEQVDYEAEMAVVIGEPGYRIRKGDAYKHVFGYTVVNDVTARDLQRGDKQWFRGKSLHTFCPMGPTVVTGDEFDCSKAPISCKVNGETRQKSNTSDLIFDVPSLIEYVSAAFPLEAGDVLSTGTPSGVGMFMTPPRWLKAGDVVEATVEGIGTLTNTVQ
jgi:2-keto-4-pentenoate hydratase/2-oxohepta-3-ene-1,7-dioic acid hydratase in catechol pathway